MKTIFSRPDWSDTATLVGTHWTKELIQMCPTEVIELYKEDARRLKNEAAIKENPESMYYGFGHGNSTVFTGQQNEVIINKDNIALWDRAWVHLLSCEVFKGLGLKFPHGSGYNALFYFYISTIPDGVARMYFDSDHQVQLARWEGLTMAEQIKRAKDKFTWYYEQHPLGGDYLIFDRNALVYTGNADDRPTPTKGIAAVSAEYQPEGGIWTQIGAMTKGENDLWSLIWKVPAEGNYKLRYRAESYDGDEKLTETGFFNVKYPESPIQIEPITPKGGETLIAKTLGLQVRVSYVE